PASLGDRVIALAEQARQILLAIPAQRPLVGGLHPFRQRGEPTARRPAHELRRRRAERIASFRRDGRRQTEVGSPVPTSVYRLPSTVCRPADRQRLPIASKDAAPVELGSEAVEIRV